MQGDQITRYEECQKIQGNSFLSLVAGSSVRNTSTGFERQSGGWTESAAVLVCQIKGLCCIANETINVRQWGLTRCIWGAGVLVFL